MTLDQDTQQTPMERIEGLTRAYAEARDELSALVTEVQSEIERITREATPAIKARVRRVADAHDRLQSAIAAHPDLWSGKRRTVVIAGVRVGVTKGKGRITWDDPDQVVRLIRRHFPDQAESLIRVKEEPIAKALANLTVAELRRIGCEVEDADDRVTIKPTDSQVDKLVAQLLAHAERIESEEDQSHDR